MTDAFSPRPEHRFTFGLWTVGNPGRDPFGHETREQGDPVRTVEKLAELGAYGVNFHDDDVIPFGSDDATRDRIIDRFKKGLGHSVHAPRPRTKARTRTTAPFIAMSAYCLMGCPDGDCTGSVTPSHPDASLSWSYHASCTDHWWHRRHWVSFHAA